MRIWVMTHEYSTRIIGGLGVVATQLAKYLGERAEMEVVVFTTGKTWSISPYTTPVVIRIPSKWLRDPKKVWEKVKEAGIPFPNLLHIHSVQYFPLTALLKKKLNLPLLYTCHSLVCLEKGKNRKQVEKEQIRLFNVANHVVVPSGWMKNEIARTYPSIALKTFVIPNGVLPFPARGYAPSYKLAYIGRIVPAKGIRQLIESMPHLITINPLVALDIYGNGTKKYMTGLKELVKELQVEARVYWHGFIKPEKIRKILPSLGAVVMPSKGESFGLVALEALASGVPLVSTCAGGMGEYVSPYVAEIIDEVHPFAIAAAIERMWRNSELTALRVEKGLFLARDYTWESIAVQYGSLMEGMK